jgi:hypothetical protein
MAYSLLDLKDRIKNFFNQGAAQVASNPLLTRAAQGFNQTVQKIPAVPQVQQSFESKIRTPLYNTIDKIPTVQNQPLKAAIPILNAPSILKGGLKMGAGMLMGEPGQWVKPGFQMNLKEQQDFASQVALGGLTVGPQAVGFKNLPNKFAGFGTDTKLRAEISDLIARIKPTKLKEIMGSASDDIQKTILMPQTSLNSTNRYAVDVTQAGRGQVRKYFDSLDAAKKFVSETFTGGSKFARLGDFFEHSGLYKQYPELKKLRVEISPSGANISSGKLGSFNPETFSIKIDPGQNMEGMGSTLLHEIQHSIQEMENFARGATPNNYKGFPAYPDPEKAYRATAGELEARAVELRRNMTAAQRRATPFSETLKQLMEKEGIKPEDVITRFKNKSSLKSAQDGLYDTTKPKGVGGVEIHPSTKKLIDRYGITKSNDTGFISKNGEMIDAPFGLHEEAVKGIGYSGDTPIHDYLKDTGDIRITGFGKTKGVDITESLTPKQYDEIVKISKNNKLVINFINDRGYENSVGGLEELKKYVIPTQPSVKGEMASFKIKPQEVKQAETAAEGLNKPIKILEDQTSQVADLSTSPKSITPTYKRGAIAQAERKIDELIGFSEGGFDRQDIERARQAYIDMARNEAPPDVVRQLDKLQEVIDGQREAKAAEQLVKEELVNNQITQIKAKQQIEKINNDFYKKFNKTIEQLKLDKKYFNIQRDELDRPMTVSAIPTEKTKVKIGKNLQKAEVKTANQEFDQWQKAFFKQEGATKRTASAINDLTKQMKESTDLSAAGLGTADGWKDKARLLLTRETMERNFEDVMKKDAPGMIKKYIDPIYENVAKETRFKNIERQEIKSLGIAPKSKESAILQDFGEGKITADQVRRISPNPEKIFNAEKVLREKYNRYLTDINKVLTRNGYDPIPKRKDYFRHFEDMGIVFDTFGIPAKAENLPTDINGLTADFKPGKNFFSSALQRKGGSYTSDAITGIDKYLDGAAQQIYRTDAIQRLRQLDKNIRTKYAGTEHLSNFVADLTEYTNLLAGKKGMIDRAAESLVGRKIYRTATALKSQTSANMVGANVSSALTNHIPLTQSLATTGKKNFVLGMIDTIKNVFKDDGFIDRSDYLTSRIGSDPLSITKWQKTQKGAGWLFSAIDKFTSQVITRSKYLENIEKGMGQEQAIKEADRWARKLMAGRAAGEMPTLFSSKTLGFLTQFQLEVNNQLSFAFKDVPRNFNKVGAASAIAQLVLYSYVFNNLFEKATGRRPAFDPIGVAQDAYEDYTNPNMKKGQATKNTVQNIAEQLPFSSIASGGRIPIGAAIPNPMKVISGESTIGKELVKPLVYLLPPTGGGQIKKTIEGVGAFQKGASTSQSGRVRFPVPQTPANAFRTSFFGQWSTPEAQTYLREGRLPLGPKQTEKFFEKGSSQDYYNQIIENRQQGKTSDISTPSVKSALAAEQLPINDNDFKVLYEDATRTVSGYKDLSSKIRTGLNESKTLEEAQQELVDSKNLLKRMEEEQPEKVYQIGLDVYKSGGGKTTEERADWALKWLSKAENKEQFDSWYQGMLESGVMTKSVLEALREKGINLNYYTEGGKIKTYSSGGRKAKAITIKKAAPVKFKSNIRKGFSFKLTQPTKVKLTKPKAIKVAKVAIPKIKKRNINIAIRKA